MDRRTYTCAQTCQRLGVHRNTLLNWRKAGFGPAWAEVRGRLIYDADSVDRFVDDQFQAAAQAQAAAVSR